MRENMRNNESRSGYLVKNIAFFALGNFGTKFISFLLVPLYTNVLTTGEYGISDLIYTIGMLLVPVITLNIAEAIMRFSLDKDADYDKIISVGIWALAIGIVLSLLIIPVCRLFPTVKSYGSCIFAYTVTSAFCQVFLSNLRGQELLLQYSIGNIIHSLAIAVCNIVLLLVLHKGIEGYLTAYAISNTVTAVYAFFVGRVPRSMTRFCFDPVLARSMIKYSLVLLPTGFMWWIMNSSDRIMITAMMGASANGIYAVAYKIPTILTTSLSIFNAAWSYSAIREEDSVDKNEYSSSVYRRMTSIVFLATGGLLALIKPFLRIYVAPEYYTAWKYTPYLLIGSAFITLGSFLATSYTVHKDSKGFLFSGIAGVAIPVVVAFALREVLIDQILVILIHSQGALNRAVRV